MSVINELWALIKPLIGMEEGQSFSKFLVKAGLTRARRLTPNFSKTILYGKDSRSELMNAFIKLLTSNDDLSKQFRASFSDALKVVNLKTSLLIDEKAKIAVEFDKQDKFKEDTVSKLSSQQANDIVDTLIDETLEKMTSEPIISRTGIPIPTIPSKSTSITDDIEID